MMLNLTQATAVLNDRQHGGHAEWSTLGEYVAGPDGEQIDAHTALALATGYQIGITPASVEAALAVEFAAARAARAQAAKEEAAARLATERARLQAVTAQLEALAGEGE